MASATPNLVLISMTDIQTTIRLESKALPIDSIVVYKDRAEIKRKIEIDAVPGVQEVVVHGLVGSLIKETVRVAGGVGDATILEVTYEERHVEPTKEAAKVTEDKLTQAKEEQKRLEKKISALQKELVCIEVRILLHVILASVDTPRSRNNLTFSTNTLGLSTRVCL